MPSSDGKIKVTTPFDLFPVDILNEELHPIGRRYGSFETDVAPGIYVIRCEAGGPSTERLVKIAAGEKVFVEFSRDEVYLMPSSAPVPGSASRREFYTYPAWNLAYESPRLSFGWGARLLFFATRPDFGINPDLNTGAPRVNWEGIRLLDRSGRLLQALPGEDGRDDNDRHAGRAGFSVDLEPAGYFIEWPTTEGSDGRSVLQPLWLSAGWITFVFAAAFGDSPTPRRDSVSIHMARMNGRPIPDDREAATINGAAELALASLRTGRRQLDDDHVRSLLHAQFENPMLGLLGGHMMLQRSTPDRELFLKVCERLRGLLGEHPDIDALELLGAERLGPRESTDLPTVFTFPPMLHEGLVALDRARWQTGEAPVLAARARLAWLRLLPEGPWTQFWHDTPRLLVLTRGSSKFGSFVPGMVDLLKVGDNRDDSNRLANAPDSIPQKDDVKPLVLAENEAAQAASDELSTYLTEFYRTRGAEAFRSLTPNHLRWARLSVEEATFAHSAVAKQASDLEAWRIEADKQRVEADRRRAESEHRWRARREEEERLWRARDRKLRFKFRWWITGGLVTALSCLILSVVQIDRASKARDETNVFQRKLAASYQNLGDVLSQRSELPAALDAYLQGLTVFKRLAEEDKSNASRQSDLAGISNKVGNVLNLEGRLQEAYNRYAEALQVYRELAQKNPEAYRAELATTLTNLGNLDLSEGRMEEARNRYAEALQVYRELAQKNPEAYRAELATRLTNLGNLDFNEGKMEEARKEFGEALQIFKALAKQNPEQFSWEVSWVEMLLGQLSM